MTAIRRLHMFGCPMDSASMQDTVDHICAGVDEGEFLQHGAINVVKLVNMQDDPELHAAVSACDLINIDGMGLVWGARLLGQHIVERVTGIDLFWQLLAQSAARHYPVYLLGARKEVVDETVRVLERQFPDLEIAGYHHGYFWEDEEAMVNLIRESGAKLLFVAITSPRKEVFINRWRDDFGVSFAMGVGGTFDVIAGRTRRAPRWMQRAGLEWLFRVLQEPRRMFKRHLVANLRFAGMMTKALLARAVGGISRSA